MSELKWTVSEKGKEANEQLNECWKEGKKKRASYKWLMGKWQLQKKEKIFSGKWFK